MWKHKMYTYVIATLMSTNLPNLENPRDLHNEVTYFLEGFEIYIIQSKLEIFSEKKLDNILYQKKRKDSSTIKSTKYRLHESSFISHLVLLICS